MNFQTSFIFSLTLLLSATLLVQLCGAQVRAVGVSEGDWFKYGLDLDWDYDLEEERATYKGEPK